MVSHLRHLGLLVFGGVAAFAALLALVPLALVILGTGLVAGVCLLWTLLALAGWLFLGSPEALHAAGIAFAIGAGAFVGNMLVWNLLMAVWERVKGRDLPMSPVPDVPFIEPAGPLAVRGAPHSQVHS